MGLIGTRHYSWISYCVWISCITFAFPLFGETQKEAKETIWSDGVYTSNIVLPLDGYYVPHSIFEKNYNITPEKVLEHSRKMTSVELASYSLGGSSQLCNDDLLFVFKNQELNKVYWKGIYSGRQQIIFRFWSGDTWKYKLPASYSALFFLPRQYDLCYVLIDKENGVADNEPFYTERIIFSSLPPKDTVVRKGIENAEVVFYIPWAWEQNKSEFIDCLKGSITKNEWQSLLETVSSSYREGSVKVSLRPNSFVFISGNGKSKLIQCSYNEENGFSGNSQILDMPTAPPENTPIFPIRYFYPLLRWVLARSAIQSPAKYEGCSLRAINSPVLRDEWLISELSVGLDSPGALFRPPMMRGQRDGGQPLISFEIRHADTTARLAPRGRFGVDSFWRSDPEVDPKLNIEYQFIDCGEGVIKLAFRPKQYPWTGTIQGHWRKEDFEFLISDKYPKEASEFDSQLIPVNLP